MASRNFAGPDQYPPREFAAYGIVAFTSQAVNENVARYRMICDAYIASLPSAELIAEPSKEQMVTVWPIASNDEAFQISKMTQRDRVCKEAVRNYGLVTALRAIDIARAEHVELNGLGPFLLAWSPSGEIGKRDALVLVSDLSDVTTFIQAREMFSRWSHDIVENPTLWRRGWDVQKLRIEIQLWADKWGSAALGVFGTGGR